MKDPHPVIYVGGAIFVAVLLYHTWPFIIGGLALAGLWCLLNHHNNDNNHRPPRCR